MHLRNLTSGGPSASLQPSLLFTLIVAATLAGCSAGGTSTAGDATFGGPDSGGSQKADGGATSGGNAAPATVCANYIACVGSVSPPLLDGVIRAYGPSGSCFSAQTADACGANCADGIVMLGAERTTDTGWKNAGCNACKTTTDCPHVGEVCSGGACLAFAQAASVGRTGMTCNFGTNDCGTGDFCSEQRTGTTNYGQGECVAATPQGQACTPNNKGTDKSAPPGFDCVDLSFSQAYGPGNKYLAKCQSGGDCPAETTCLNGGGGGDPLSHCVGPRKQ